MSGSTMSWSQIVANILAMITPQMEAGLIGIALFCALVYGIIHHHYGWFWGAAIGSGVLVSLVWAVQTAFGVSV